MWEVGLGVICPRCGEDKAPGEFRRNASERKGKQRYCKACRNAHQRELVRQRHGNTRHYHLTQRYSLSAGDVAHTIEAQGGVCAICRSNEATQVDHDHTTGDVRGITCLDCNAGLGAFGDDPALLFAAVDYLHPVPAEEWIK